MSIEYKEDPIFGIIEITLDGKVTESDYDQVITKLETFIQQQPEHKINILEIIKNYDGMDWSVMAKGIKFDMEHRKNYQKCAVVSDSGWIGPVSRLFGVILSCDIRTFGMNQVEAARSWLRANNDQP